MRTEPEIICDGCNVKDGWEHRCHGDRAMVLGVQTLRPCECKECRELEAVYWKNVDPHTKPPY